MIDHETRWPYTKKEGNKEKLQEEKVHIKKEPELRVTSAGQGAEPGSVCCLSVCQFVRVSSTNTTTFAAAENIVRLNLSAMKTTIRVSVL